MVQAPKPPTKHRPREQSLSARRPWDQISPVFSRILRPELDDITKQMVRVIRSEVPEYDRPPETRTGRDLLSGVRHALCQFVELIDDPTAPQEHNAVVFQRLGAVEMKEGRTMDSLQAAYRIGAQVACRKYIEVARAASMPHSTTMLLSEAVLAHINMLAKESLKGYADAQARAAGVGERRRRRLAERLLERESEHASPSTQALASQAAWPLPNALACVTVEAADGRPVLDEAELGDDVLVLARGEQVHLLIPDPDVARLDRVREQVAGFPAALGPTVPPAESWRSAYYAKAMLRLVRRGMVDGQQLVRASDHLSSLQLLGDEQIAHMLTRCTLDIFTGLPKGKAARLEDTLHALLTSWGRTAPEVASALGIHPQTARNRLRQLEELLGHRLTDPHFRFVAEAALRTRALLHKAK